MINRINLIRNVGLFDSVSDGATIPLTRLTLVYGENGRGKTTIAAVLRSLATGDPIPIAERRRLAAQNPPHVVLECGGVLSPMMFQNNAWNHTFPNMVVFDDMFVDQNLYSGLSVDSEHQQNLHELILGARGVSLNQQVQRQVDNIEAHNAALRAKGAVIPVAERGMLTVDDFCALQALPDIDEAIQVTERNLAAAREQDPIRNALLFDTLTLPVFEIAMIDHVLQQDLPSLDAAAVARVQDHLAGLSQGSETWVADGMRLFLQADGGASLATCPFCAQDFAASPVINHYREYFSNEYSNLKRIVSDALTAINRTHGGDVPTTFERLVRVIGERRQFWSRFCDVPDVTLDTEAITRDWRTARDAVVAALTAKQAAPLERMTLEGEVRAAVAAYETQRQTIVTLNQQLQEANAAICLVREQATAGNPVVLNAELTRLKAVKARYTPTIAALCDDYLREKAAKVQTEQLRNQARTALNQYRTGVFPGHQTAINRYLGRFNAGFRLDSVTHRNTRTGSTCTYNVVINNTPVAVGGRTPTPGQPSFCNTLSAGDRNTLALAFFFASLDQDPSLDSKVVVIDDPIASLDEHRSLTTVQETRRLAERAMQVIVLSHNKPFLCRIWGGTDRSVRTAIQVIRDGAGSTIRSWDVDQDSITEHDRRHSILRDYLTNNQTFNNREIARSIRPLLEAFLRVAFPKYFPPGTLLGPFQNLCEQRVGTPQEILDAQDIQDLRDLIEYANRFHHDTNPAWETEAINDGELTGFVQRALTFATRRR